jgi:parallel beta-helix repeat protein
MRKTVAVSFGLLLVLSMCATVVLTAAIGDEQGEFPNRLFEVWKGDRRSPGGGVYVTSIAPTEDGTWWVSLVSLSGTFVAVRVYENQMEGSSIISSSRMDTVGDESRHVQLSAGSSYVVKFCVGGRDSDATLREHFSSGAMTDHEPIQIWANSEFTQENGVVGGSGTQPDPYVISNWHINASLNHGIHITGTDAYFVIANVVIDIGTEEWTMYDGIHLSNVMNGIVYNSTFGNVYYGVYVEQSRTIGLLSSAVRGCTFAVDIVQSTEVVVMDSTIYDCFGGMAAEYSSSITFTGNTVMGCETEGLLLYSSVGCELSGNSFLTGGTYGFGDGILLMGEEVAHFNTHTISTTNNVCGRPIIYIKDSPGSTIEDTSVGQIIVVNSAQFRAANLQMPDADVGIELAYVTSASISDCVIGRGGIGIYALQSTRVEISGCSIGPTSVGLYMIGISGLVVEDCWVSSPQEEGVIISECTGVMLSGSTIEGCQEALIVESSGEVLLADNMIRDNSQGVMVYWSARVQIIGNCLLNTGGLTLGSTTPATVYGNVFIDEWMLATDDSPAGNSWYRNYWSDYVGNDADGDGIGDTPFYFEVGASDPEPLMSPPRVKTTVETDKHWYAASETVRVVVTVTNMGSTPVTLKFPDSGRAYFVVEDILGSVMYNDRYHQTVMPYFNYLTLESGEAASYSFSWAQVTDGGSHVPVPANYPVDGVMNCVELVLVAQTMIGIC